MSYQWNDQFDSVFPFSHVFLPLNCLLLLLRALCMKLLCGQPLRC